MDVFSPWPKPQISVIVPKILGGQSVCSPSNLRKVNLKKPFSCMTCLEKEERRCILAQSSRSLRGGGVTGHFAHEA